MSSMNKIVCVAILLMMHKVLYCQPNNHGYSQGNISIPSPNASSLGSYGNIPVNMFTGLPNVNVPLYNYQFHDIHVPINLSYQYRGFRPNEHPSWVGLGWTLQAGGVVTRIKKGEPDEMEINGSSYNYCYLYNSNRWQLKNIDVGATLNSLMYGQGQKDIKSSGTLGNGGVYFFDTEPDEFAFNFNGISGSFYFDNDANIVVKTDADISLDVTVNISTSPLQLTGSIDMKRYIKEFTFTDKDGMKYIFGGDYYNDHSVEVSYGAPASKYGSGSNYEIGNNAYTSAWYLKKIESPTNHILEFIYESDYYIAEIIPNFELEQYLFGGVNYKKTNYNTYSVSVSTASYLKEIKPLNGTGTQSVKFVRDRIHLSEPSSQSNNWQGIERDYEIVPDYAGKLHQDNVTAYNIYGITITNSNLDKTFENRFQKLKAIELYEESNLQKAYNFSYFNTYDNNTHTGRLELKDITIKGRNNGTMPYYSFDYYSTTGSHVEYGTRKVDHWGYYNGVDNLGGILDTATITDISSLVNSYTSSREPSFTQPQTTPLCAEGALQKVIYPTGGVTEFYYEPNNYRKFPSFNTSTNSIDIVTETANQLTGGIRIWKIKSIPTTDPNNTGLLPTGPAIVKKYYYTTQDAIPTNVNNVTSSGVLNSGKPKYYEAGTLNVWPYETNPIGSPSALYTNYKCLSSTPNIPLLDGAHVGYSKVVEEYGDGSYKVYEFSNSDNGTNNQYADKATNIKVTTFDLGSGVVDYDLDYNSVVSMSHERGKLLSEKYYTSTGILKKSIVHEYNDDPARFNKVINSITKMGKVINNPVNPSVPYYTVRSYANRVYTYHHYLKKITETEYLDNSTTMQLVKEYQYDADRNVVNTKYYNSNNTIDENVVSFSNNPVYVTPASYIGATLVDGIKKLRSLKIRNAPIEELKRKTVNGTAYIVDGTLYGYKADIPIVAEVHKLSISAPVLESNFVKSSLNGANQFFSDINYEKKITVPQYTLAGYATQINDFDTKTAIIRDYQQRYVVAVAKGVNLSDIAYTSFEGQYNNDMNPDPNKGNWKFKTEYMLQPYTFPLIEGNTPNNQYRGFTGNKSFKLRQDETIESQYALQSGKEYIISFWTQETANATVRQNGSVINDNVYAPHAINNPTPPGGTIVFDNYLNPRADNSLWRYTEMAFVSNGYPLVITGDGNIDELRLAPLTSTMETYTYDTEKGEITTRGNNMHDVYRYIYDEFGRLIEERERDKSLRYKYQYGIREIE